MRADAMRIIRAALAAVDPRELTRLSLAPAEGQISLDLGRLDPSSFENVYLLGMGKAGATMALGAEEALGDRLTRGLAVVKDGYGVAGLRLTEVLEAGHPLPDRRNAEAARRIFDLAAEAGEEDLVICLISGGSSALMALPAGGLSLDDVQEVTGALFTSGAEIGGINAVRKHITLGAGGRLARAAAPARLVSLIVSDVIGDRLDVIASGPTAADSTTYADALGVLEAYGLIDSVPPAVVAHLQKGRAGEVPETPKPGDPELERVVNRIICSNRTAVRAAAAAAAHLGYAVIEMPEPLTGEARREAAKFLEFARRKTGSEAGTRPVCVVAGGETVVRVTGGGRGGRAQEFVLAGARGIEGRRDALLFAVGTDGTDGPTDAAGAFADGATLRRAAAAGLSPERYLTENDAYPFFQELGDLIMTGPTGTNVNDLHCLMTGQNRVHHTYLGAKDPTTWDE